MSEQDETQALAPQEGAKREYRRPELVELGDVRDLFKGAERRHAEMRPTE